MFCERAIYFLALVYYFPYVFVGNIDEKGQNGSTQPPDANTIFPKSQQNLGPLEYNENILTLMFYRLIHNNLT